MPTERQLVAEYKTQFRRLAQAVVERNEKALGGRPLDEVEAVTVVNIVVSMLPAPKPKPEPAPKPE